ncbi:hypothetical protein [Tunicatimonas pelagia]|uniref:hypothetical protein n=1 Tax=Tunicatimonas pelagia TaxID=931531 RepID=UPI002666375E|nr:hypothetical protein [Tunicatimonas pelagia]WKN43194.1 hypothetical protein P0M28_29565 [Tunicatimonas pelagia]
MAKNSSDRNGAASHQFIKQEYGGIPELFYSHTTQAPFERCISCDRALQAPNTQYLVEKAFRNYPDFKTTDVIFEYAMCLSCADQMRKELSLSSLSRIQEFFENRVDFHLRRDQLMQSHSLDAPAWLENCLITGKAQHTLEEYQIYGHFMDNRCVYSFLPYMIGGPAVDEITSLLSEKTLGEIDRFIDENFGLPPELKQPIRDNPIIFV